eukprot:m51a1_g13241 hypothetical protein (178) ;mRNA; f:1489-2192
MTSTGKKGSAYMDTVRSGDLDTKKPEEIPWGTIKELDKWSVFYNKPVETLEQVQDKNYFMENVVGPLKIKFKLWSKPFAAGAERLCFYGQDCTGPKAEPVVFKKFKTGGEVDLKFEHFLEFSETIEVCKYFAAIFNERLRPEKTIQFIKTRVIHLDERNSPDGKQKNLLMEPSNTLH